MIFWQIFLFYFFLVVTQGMLGLENVNESNLGILATKNTRKGGGLNINPPPQKKIKKKTIGILWNSTEQKEI